MDLAFYSSEELIAELMRRQTFLGVVVHSAEEMKNGQWGEERNFRIHFNSNLEAAQAARLLDRVASYMDANFA